MTDSKNAYIHKYKLVEQDEYLAERPDKPYAQVVSTVSTETFLPRYAAFRKKRTVPAVIFFLIGAALIIFAMTNADSFSDENTAYFITLFAAVPLGIAGYNCLVSFLKSAFYIRKMIRKTGLDLKRITDAKFFPDCIVHRDRLLTFVMFKNGAELIPCSAIVKIYEDEECFALIDKDDHSIFMMNKDIPPELYSQIFDCCKNAKKITM